MKQIQFATVPVEKGPTFNAEVRAALEGPLNNGWELQGWQAFDTVNAEAQPIYNVVVCLTREQVEAKASKAKKDD
jgi:hypothetical protein